jgi:hypothetical protein
MKFEKDKIINFSKTHINIIKFDLINIFLEVKKSKIQTKIFLILFFIIIYVLLLPEANVSNGLAPKSSVNLNKAKPKTVSNNTKNKWERVKINSGDYCNKLSGYFLGSSVRKFVSAKLSVSMQSIKPKGFHSRFPICTMIIDTQKGIHHLIVNEVYTKGGEVQLMCRPFECRVSKPSQFQY